MRVFLAAAEKEARLHHLMAGFVDWRRLVVNRAQDRVAVGRLGHEGEVLADFDAGHVGLDRPERPAHVVGGVGLEVPGVELAGAADEEEEDAVDVLRPLGRVEVGQRQGDGAGAQGADFEEVAPRQAVAEPNTFPSFKVQHDRSPPVAPGAGPRRSPTS